MIFVDTWAWVALADRSDPYHDRALARHRQLTQAKQLYVTSDYVLSETITYLYDALPVDQAQKYLLALFAATDRSVYELSYVSPEQFQRAWVLRQKYHDKPDISFADFTSMVIMQDLGVNEIFTGDSHFVQVNLGFLIVS